MFNSWPIKCVLVNARLTLYLRRGVVHPYHFPLSHGSCHVCSFLGCGMARSSQRLWRARHLSSWSQITHCLYIFQSIVENIVLLRHQIPLCLCVFVFISSSSSSLAPTNIASEQQMSPLFVACSISNR